MPHQRHANATTHDAIEPQQVREHMSQTFPPFGLPVPDTDEARERVLQSEDKVKSE